MALLWCGRYTGKQSSWRSGQRGRHGQRSTNRKGATMRFTISLAGLLLASALFAAEPKVHRDLPYANTKNEQQTLDVYAPAEGKDHPVVVWIHGGGWQAGDKA